MPEPEPAPDPVATDRDSTTADRDGSDLVPWTAVWEDADVPSGFRLDLDPGTRRTDDGCVLIGGSPVRIVRLRPAGSAVIDAWQNGAPVGRAAGHRRLARRLLDAGLAHPRPNGPGPFTAADVTCVVPVRDRAADLARTLHALASSTFAAASGSGPQMGSTNAPPPALGPDGQVGADADKTTAPTTFAAASGSGPQTGSTNAPRPALGSVVVVDDGSADPAAIETVAARYGARVVRRERNGGPAAARNTGLDHVTTALVAFVDCDVEPDAGWLATLLPHLADPRVAAVAPRVRAFDEPVDSPVDAPGRATSTSARVRFERSRSPLDLGPRPARVVPHGRIAYVPSTTLLARRAIVEHAGRFDDRLRFGEDVDLVWRIIEAGHTVRYEPAAVVRHPTRATLAGWLRQRYDYGTAAAALDARHPGSVPPISMSGWTATAWALAGAGHPVAGAALAAGVTARLPRRLDVVDQPWREAWRLGGGGQVAAWRPIASALTRTWWPITVAAAIVSPRARRTAALAALVPPLVDWAQGERDLDPVRYTALRLMDDLAYGTGVWAGCVRAGSAGALAPALASWPARRRGPAAADGPGNAR